MAELLPSEETIKKYTDYFSTEFERYRSDREVVQDSWELADNMYACESNRSLAKEQRAKTLALSKDTRAQTGSVMFHRQVNILAAQLVQVLRSNQDWWKYGPVGDPERPLSMEDARELITNAQILARWIRKQDGVDERMPEFAVSLYKYSIAFIHINQYQRRDIQIITTPTYGVEQDSQTGESKTVIVGEKQAKVEKITKNYPSIKFLHPDMVYADRYIPRMADQNCAVVLSIVTRTDLYNAVLSGDLDENAYKELKDDSEWNGDIGAEARKREAETRGEQFQPGKGLFLRWDVYCRQPIKNGVYSEEAPPALYHGVYVGNDATSVKCMRLEPCQDPDGEIPIKEVRPIPDQQDELYHTTTSHVTKALYSADSTLMNLALDNMTTRQDPPLMVIDGAHRVKDFTIKRGQRWHVDNPSAITPFSLPDVTQPIGLLRDQIQREIMTALSTDQAMMGQYAGARTSATEFMGVSQNTRAPHIMMLTYVLNQMLPWLAKKYMSYMEAFLDPNQVAQIVDADKQYSIKVAEIVGQYDVSVDLIDEYENSEIEQRAIDQVMQIVGSVPYFQQSPHHTLDAGELLKEWIRIKKIKNPARIITNPVGVDSENAASMRINAMLNLGQYTPPQQGENLQIHLRMAQAERIRWQGLEEENDPRVKNLPLLDQYIAELKMLMQGQAAQMGSMAAIAGEQTPGQMSGQQIAAAVGGQ